MHSDTPARLFVVFRRGGFMFEYGTCMKCQRDSSVGRDREANCGGACAVYATTRRSGGGFPLLAEDERMIELNKGVLLVSRESRR